MSITITEVAEKRCLALGEDYTDPDTRELFHQFIVDAYQEILVEEEWPFTHDETDVALSSGTQEYTLTSNALDLHAAQITEHDDYLEYTPGSVNVIDQDKTGRPTHLWYSRMVDGVDKFKVWPIPDDNYTLRLFYHARAQSGFGDNPATDVINVPDEIILAIRHRVEARYYEHVNEMDLASAAMQRYLGVMDKVKERLLTPAMQRNQMAYTDMPMGHRWPKEQLPDTITG